MINSLKYAKKGKRKVLLSYFGVEKDEDEARRERKWTKRKRERATSSENLAFYHSLVAGAWTLVLSLLNGEIKRDREREKERKRLKCQNTLATTTLTTTLQFAVRGLTPGHGPYRRRRGGHRATWKTGEKKRERERVKFRETLDDVRQK